LPDVDIDSKVNKLSSAYRGRVIKEDKKLLGVSKIDLSKIKSIERLKFLKEFVINLAKCNE